MAIRNLKDNSKKPWLCECYPQGRNGKRIRKRFATKGEAAAFELFTMKEVDDKPWLGDKPDHRRLSDLADTWHQLHGKSLKSGEHSILRINHIVNALNNPIASHLTSKDFAYYRANRVSKGRGREDREMSISSNNIDLALLKSVFNKLIALNEWKFPNPLTNMEPLKGQPAELAFLSEQEIKNLLETVESSRKSNELKSIFKICLSTGARINEVVQLKGSQLSKYKITYINTKGKKNRTIPISKELYEEIHKPTNDRLFSCSYGVAYKWLTKALPYLPDGQATHVLRHTFASHFMINGGNILVLKEILGHSKIDQTMVYAHFSPNHLSDAVKFNPITNLTK